MTTTPDPIVAAAVSAAAPSLIAVLQAVQTLMANMGTDPAQFKFRWPGALQVFIGSVELQLPTLAASEIGALQAQAGTKIAGLIASLQKA